MAYSSSVGRPRRTASPATIGTLPIPNPQTWPEAAKDRFRELTGNYGPLDVFIFRSGRVAAMYLQDAVTALGILDVDSAGWHTEDGYPAYQFDSQKVEEYSRRLAACGYKVKTLQMSAAPVRSEARAKVIDIGRVRHGRTPKS